MDPQQVPAARRRPGFPATIRNDSVAIITRAQKVEQLRADRSRCTRTASSTGQPGVIEGSWPGPIHLIAKGLGARVEEVRGSLDREPAGRDIEVAFGAIPAGTCGAVRTRAAGMVNGREAIVVDHIIRRPATSRPAGCPQTATPPTRSISRATRASTP
jgi:hypothetical protein